MPDLPPAALAGLAQTLASRLAPGTWATYAVAFTRFVRFCAPRQLSPLPATTATVLLYADFLAKEGHIQAATAQPYFSAINTLHELTALPRPAVGQLLASFRAGWQRRQTLLIPLPSAWQTRAMPAGVAACVLRRLPQLHEVVPLRASLFFVLAFVTMLRPDSLLSCLALAVSGSTLTYTPLRYKTTVPTPGLASQVDISRLPELIGAILRFVRLRGALGPAQSWFQLPREPAPSTPTAAAWFDMARSGALILNVYTMYSLRRGGASSALAAGAARDKIEFLGGWGPGSSALRRHYLDLSFPNDRWAQLFFGWLASGALPVAGHANAFGR